MTDFELETQNLARSSHEALILAILADGPRHGYQLALEIEDRSDGSFRFNHGTLYPILHKLEKQGLIEGVWSNEGPRGKRKSYALTDAGREFAKTQRESWFRFIEHLQSAIGEAE